MKLFGIIFLSLLLIAGIAFGLSTRESTIFQNHTQEPTNLGEGVGTPSPNEESPEIQPSSEELNQQQIEASTSLLNSAIVTANPLLCEQILIEEMKEVCIEQANYSLAQNENDPSKCEFLSGTGITECKDQVYYQIALESKDEVNCKKIDGIELREKCIEAMEMKLLKDQTKNRGTETNTETLDCDTFTNSLAKEQCLVERQNVENQTNLKDAIENQSTESCEAIEISNLKQDCYDSIYLLRAKSNKNLEICKNIINEETKAQCVRSVSDSSDSQLFERAIIEQSIDVCKQISTEAIRLSCIDRIRISEIISSGKKDECATLNDPSLRQNCMSSFQK